MIIINISVAHFLLSSSDSILEEGEGSDKMAMQKLDPIGLYGCDYNWLLSKARI